MKWNSIECEHFDFLFRHNRVYNNLIMSRFDVTVKKECDVCKVMVETCMHEFFECGELKVYFERLKGLIDKCWGDRILKTMVWKELWLFGVSGGVKGPKVNLCNYVLSHARYAVKLRRDLAHFGNRKVDVWDLFKKEKDAFLENFVDGCTLVEVGDNDRLVFKYDSVG